MKPLVIYHANCADGFGAAFAAWLKFGDEAEYVPFKYNEGEMRFKTLFQLGDPKRDIYILDFSFPRELMDWLFSVAKKVIWLDHHKTAFEMWCEDGERQFFEWAFMNEPENDSYIKLDNSKSGAMIAWEYFHPATEVPMLIKHIDDYDRWIFAIEGTKEFNKALWSYAPWSFEQWDAAFIRPDYRRNIDVVSTYDLETYIAEGAAILRAHDANVEAVVAGAARKCAMPRPFEFEYSKSGKITILDSNMPKASRTVEDKNDNVQHAYLDGIAANCPPHLSSDVGHQLANQSGTYGLLWSINKEGKCVCSLRSNGDYDVSAIAKYFGGGGHKNAAGFEVDINQLLEWIK